MCSFREALAGHYWRRRLKLPGVCGESRALCCEWQPVTWFDVVHNKKYRNPEIGLVRRSDSGPYESTPAAFRVRLNGGLESCWV